MGKKQSLTFPGRYDEIKNICAFVTQGAADAGLDETAVFHIELACDEACTNIIEHAYQGEDKGSIVVSWQVDGSQFRITLQDNGRTFNPADIPEPTIPNDAKPNDSEIQYDQLQVGGLGIHFMRKLMDEVIFEFNDHAGNRLTLTKNIQ
jgi:serine/threonine-protein kinase RsbW